VGKTTVVGEIVQTARRLERRVLLAAPTGRAAKRMTETCNREAKTIHRLLKWDPQTRRFIFSRDRPLKCDFLIVDEVSMLDVELANHLFAAVKPETHVILVGDRDQLPSVGPGAVLHDLIASRRIPVTHLTEIYRQAEGSRIVLNAHAVNRGEMPDLRTPPRHILGDFYWINQPEPERVVEIIAEMVRTRIPRRFRFDPMSDIQVLTPMNKGQCGAIALNAMLQEALNSGPKPQFNTGERTIKAGDRVMQVVNNYDKGVFNGELGRVVHIDRTSKKFQVLFDAGLIDYEFQEADQLKHAYAVTVHKSQGSEFPVVIIPVLTQHYVMLQRNLIYTGMTRARRLLIMVGAPKALAIAVHNDRPALRYTQLAARIRAGHSATPA
jgi:exodeoxyribonuclease V alpha subunit